MNKKITFFVILIVTFSMTFLVGRGFRTSQVPNGIKYSCNTCHTSGGGSSRNAFGLDVQNNFLSGGNVVWGAELAGIDSDGDGFTNGEELQDPNGEWIEGTTAPGDLELVTNPGDPNDFPPVTSLEDIASVPFEFELGNNYPNPFNPSTRISFKIAENSSVLLEIYNLLGERVRVLVNENYSPGNYTAVWNARDDFGYKVNSGIYIYRMVTNNFVDSKRMVLMK